MATQYPEFARKMRDEPKKIHETKDQNTQQKPAAQPGVSFDDQIQSVIVSKPLAALAVALSVGFVASLFLRRSRRNEKNTPAQDRKAATTKTAREVH